MTLEAKSHSDPPTSPSSWVFYRPEWVSIGEKTILYIVTKLIKNWVTVNKRFGSKNGLVASYGPFEDFENQVVI